MYGSWDMVHNKWTDGWKKWHIEGAAPPKNPDLTKTYPASIMSEGKVDHVEVTWKKL